MKPEPSRLIPRKLTAKQELVIVLCVSRSCISNLLKPFTLPHIQKHFQSIFLTWVYHLTPLS